MRILVQQYFDGFLERRVNRHAGGNSEMLIRIPNEGDIGFIRPTGSKIMNIRALRSFPISASGRSGH